MVYWLYTSIGIFILGLVAKDEIRDRLQEARQSAIFLNLPRLHVIMGEARMAQFRLENSPSYKSSDKPEISSRHL